MDKPGLAFELLIGSVSLLSKLVTKLLRISAWCIEEVKEYVEIVITVLSSNGDCYRVSVMVY